MSLSGNNMAATVTLQVGTMIGILMTTTKALMDQDSMGITTLVDMTAHTTDIVYRKTVEDLPHRKTVFEAMSLIGKKKNVELKSLVGGKALPRCLKGTPPNSQMDT